MSQIIIALKLIISILELSQIKIAMMISDNSKIDMINMSAMMMSEISRSNDLP